MADYSDCIENISGCVWESVETTLEGHNLWWHCKWYKRQPKLNGRFDGMQEHELLKNEFIDKKPHKRELFYDHAGGRFAPGGCKASYFGSDLPTATCETYDELRFFEENEENGKELTEEIMNRIFYEDGDSKYKGVGYPLNYWVDSSARIVDLRRANNRLFAEIANNGAWADGLEFFKDIVVNRNAASETTPIAERAFELGFNGIWYKSVRTPKDSTSVTLGDCLVLFEGSEALVCHSDDTKDTKL